MTEVQRVVEKLKAQDENNIAFVPIDHLSFTGCHYHPSVADDKAIAEVLLHFIDSHSQIWRSNGD